jgi:hypothetical protein
VAFATGLAGLLVGGLLGYALSNQSESSATSNGGGPALTRTVTNTTTVVHPKVLVRTNTVTSNTVTQAPANPANEQRRVEAEAQLHKVEKENEELRRAEAG